MAQESYSASVPGSLMLMGEHAVLYGYPCLVCAIDQRLTVTVSPRLDRQVHIRSTLGTAVFDLDALPATHATFSFVLAAIKRAPGSLPQGCDLSVTAEFSDQWGFGSSAAVVVGTVAALGRWLDKKPLSSDVLFALSKQAVWDVQQLGSGADVAASVFGGVLQYQADTLQIKPLGHDLPLWAVYSGYKKKTPEVVAMVRTRYEAQSRGFTAVFEAMRVGVLQAAEQIQQGRWAEFGQLMNVQHGLMNALGVSDAVLETLVGALRATAGVLGAKISGSGLGDCVVAIGEPMDPAAAALRFQTPQQRIPLSVARKGVQYVD